MNNGIKKIFVLIHLLFLIQLGSSQSTVKGIVVDIVTGIPISDVNIQPSEYDLALGTATNSVGEFKIEATRFPLDLKFTHIGYETQTARITEASEKIVIQLIPSSKILDEVFIQSTQVYETVSTEENYSIINFEISEDKLLWLEYRSSFNSKILTILDLQSQEKLFLELDNVKFIESLYISCIDQAYLITRDFAYAIIMNSGEIKLGKEIKISVFNDFIKPCILRQDNDLIYKTTSFNGLKTIYARYNVKSETVSNFITVSQDEEIEQYKGDLSLINKSQSITNIRTNSTQLNKKIRDLQKKGDFLEMNYYRPEFQNFIFFNAYKLIFLNHIKGRIDTYLNYKLKSSQEISYTENKKWLEHIILDQKTKEVYTLFKGQNGVNVEKLNIMNGTTLLVSTIETNSQNSQSFRIHNGYIYFLTLASPNSSKKILKRIAFE